jgi:hypothetical protein
LVEDLVNEMLEFWKMAIVRTQSTSQSPEVFDWVQVRAVRRKEVDSNHIFMVLNPGANLFGIMPPGIVQRSNHGSALSSL